MTTAIADELSNEQLLTIVAAETVTDLHLIYRYKSKPIVVCSPLIEELFKADSKVLDVFIAKYENAGWTIVKQDHDKLVFTK